MPLAVLHAAARATATTAILRVHLTRFSPFVKYPSKSVVD